MSLLYRDDVGANIVVSTSNTAIPVTAVLSLFVEKPGGSTVEWAITGAMTNYTTGVLTYATLAGDLDETGEYKVQVHGVFSDADLYSDIDTFSVQERLDL
jgi:hypothetical protein